MKRLNYCFAVFILSFCLLPSLSFARDCPRYALACGAAVTYNVTMNKMEVSTSGSSTNAVTIVSSPQTFDIAAANAGAVVGSWFSGTTLAPGTYNWMRRTVSRTFTAKGYLTYRGNVYYTSSNPDTATYGRGTNLRAVAAGTYTFVGSDAPADYAVVSFSIPDPPGGFSLPTGMTMTSTEVIQEDTSNTMTIAICVSTTMRIIFNVQNTLQLQQVGPVNMLQLGEPDASATIISQ